MRIETERLLLCAHQIEDFEDYRTFWAPGPADVPGPPPLGHEESWQRLLRMIGHWQVFGHGMFAVREKASGRIVGEAGIGHFERDIDPAFNASPEAGWKIDVSCWGKGYAGEAMVAAYDWFDRAFAHDRTVCIIDHANAPSLKLADRLGFTATGEAPYRGKPILLFERFRP